MMMSESRLAPVAPAARVKTVYSLFPLMVTRMVALGLLPLAGPMIAVLGGRDRPLVSVMVFCSAELVGAKTVELKVIFPAPAVAAAASASRSEQVEPVPLVQSGLGSVMSEAVVTTKPGGAWTTIPVAVALVRPVAWAVMVCVPTVANMTMKVPTPAVMTTGGAAVAALSLVVMVTF